MDEREWRAALEALDPAARERAESLLLAYGRLFERHRLVSTRHQAMSAALDRLPLALLVIDGVEIVWANQAADALLVRGGPLAVESERTIVKSDTLEAAITATRTDAGHREAVALDVDGERWHIVLLGELDGPVLAAIAIGDGPALDPKADEYQVLFGLTAREARVATLLLAGRTGREIAEVLDVGFETARSHVKHVLRKMGCPRQAAAVLALAISPATVGPETTNKLAEAGE